MKQKVSIWWLSARLGLFLLPASVPQLLSAQVDSPPVICDSVQIKPEGMFPLSPSDYYPKKIATFPLYPSNLYPSGSYLPKQIKYSFDFSLKREIYLPYLTNPSPIFRGDYRTDGTLKQFRHGTLFGSGGQTSLPGILRINDASLGYQHIFNQKLALQLQANAMKINMAHFTGQAFSASGTLLYRPSDRIAFKFFGSYDIGNSYGMSTHRYGATMSVDMSDRFGMEVGAQRYYDAMRGHWETVPIIIPYYHFEKFTLGLDVGGLLYEVLREFVFDKQRNSGPTIAPPHFSMPIR